jgi:ADP-dependent phosphofructokinase/glucokinase
MHHRHRHRHGFGHGFRRFGRFNRDEMLPRLEEYQRDLEQELADVADLIRRLKEGEPAQTSTV